VGGTVGARGRADVFPIDAWESRESLKWMMVAALHLWLFLCKQLKYNRPGHAELKKSEREAELPSTSAQLA